MPLKDYFKVNIVEQHKLIYSKITGSVTHEAYKTAMLHVASLITEHHLTNWLIDASASAFTLHDQRWTVESFGLLVRNTLLTKVAMVHQNDLFMELAAESMRLRIYELYGQLQHLEHFEDLEGAIHWLVPYLPVSAVLPNNR